MYNVNLPNLKWFLSGNVYSGSLRPNPSKSYTCQTTFNYRVKVVDDKCGKSVVAVCFFVLPWNSVSNMDEAVIGRFQVSEFGIEVAENWIRSHFITESPNVLMRLTRLSLYDKLWAKQKYVENKKIIGYN